MGLNEKFFRSADEDEGFFNTVLYDGTGVSNPITGVGFQPDLVWIKRRNTAAADHYIVDTVRGNGSNTYKNLASNEQQSEGTTTSSGITNSSIVDGGFTMQGTGARTNANGSEYVAWCFKAGGAAVTNTDGSRTSQVSANVAGGFSIVRWSGNSVSGSTIGHGLGVAPELVIIKNLSNSLNWSVYSSPTGSGKKLILNSIAGEANTSNFVSTTPTGSVFSLSGGNEVNQTGSNYIAYCFHSVAGVSKVGSYTGANSSVVVPTGFEPAFVMIKFASGTTAVDYGGWLIYDNKRDTTNPVSVFLQANTDGTEFDNSSYSISFNSTGGFTVGSTQNDAINYDGNEYIYYAIA